MRVFILDEINTRSGRSDRVRTCGLNIPNVARSQLRHTPIFIQFFSFCVEVGQTVVKRKFHAVLRFRKTPKVRTVKGFSGLSHFCGYNC